MKKQLEFKWGWCESCGCPFIRCPKCGNNCCNGGFGEVGGESCDVCNLAYQYQGIANRAGLVPKTMYDVDEKFNIKEKNENSTVTSIP